MKKALSVALACSMALSLVDVYKRQGQDAADQGTRDRGTSRPDWVFMLTRDQIQDYTMEQVLGGTDGWNPGT